MPFILVVLFSIGTYLSSAVGGGGSSGSATSSTNTAIIIPDNGSSGNSGSGDSPPPPPPPPPWLVSSAEADNYRTAEYNAQWGLEAMHMAEAYMALEKNGKAIAGNGVKIAIISSGIKSDHVDLKNNYLTLGSNDYVNKDSDPNDDNGLGTSLAGIIAAEKNDAGMHGVAYESKIIVEKILNASGSGSSANTALAIQNAVANGAKIIDLKVSTTSDIATIKNSLIDNVKTNDVLVVVGVGDGSKTAADYPARYASSDALKNYVIAVTAVDSGGNLYPTSNQCGASKSFCLAAPGVDIFSTDKNGEYSNFSNSAVAAANVAGAAGVLRAAWPFLTAPQIESILFTTATDLGETGSDVNYGVGILNLYEAVKAQGEDHFGFGNASSLAYNLRSSLVISDPIFGDAFAGNVASALQNAVFFDDYGRDYKAFFGQNFVSKKNYFTPNLNQIAFLNITSNSMPLRFKKAVLNFQLSKYKNSEVQNIYGLKHMVLDRSIDPQNYFNNGMSLSYELTDKTKFGFAFNIDESAKIEMSEVGNSGFILRNNMAANPYQSFFQGASIAGLANKKFNQFFGQSNFFEKKLFLKFTYQFAYDASQINAGFNNQQNQLLDLAMSYQKPNYNFTFSVGKLNEFGQNMLNSQSLGAFASGSDSAKTSYFKISAIYNLSKNFTLFSFASEGISEIKGNQLGIFQNFNDIKSRSAGLGVIYNDLFNGKIGISYVEPLRVYHGSVNMNIPTGRDIAGNVLTSKATASLVPQGKEKDLEIFYSKELKKFATINFNFLTQKQAGNFKNMKNGYLGWVSYNLNF